MKIKVFEFGSKFLININEFSVLSSGPNKDLVYKDIEKNYNRLLREDKTQALEKMLKIMGYSANKNLIDYSLNIKEINKDFYVLLPDNRELGFKEIECNEDENECYFSIFVRNEHCCNCYVSANNIKEEIEEIIVNIIEHNYYFKNHTPKSLFDFYMRNKFNYLPILCVIDKWF